MTDFFEKANLHFQQKLPFVIYKKPNNNQLIGFFQQDDSLNSVKDFSENGFVFCSFDGNKNILIPENTSEILKSEIEPKSFDLNSEIQFNDTKGNKENFEKIVTKAIDLIKKNEFDKVVLSRKETILLKKFELISCFEKLINTYNTAFCYCFYHPKIGIWLGATPEQLIQIENNSFETVSLAGTQKFQDDKKVIWSEKEKTEQLFVTNYIAENLDKFSNTIAVSEPKTIQAGNLLHIKSVISGKLNYNFELKNLLETLHPTPAVCGLPKQISKKFILENEDYERKFYSGFLGEINLDNKTDLFVNLRCMEVLFDENKNKKEYSNINIYVGCGITKDSVPEKEWEETVNKSKTMKKILDNQIL